MFTIFGIPSQLFYGQLMLGIVNGAFYALLSLGLAVIFGMLGILNFAHGALYMLGAFVAYILLESFQIGYWWALLIAPLVVAAFGALMETTLIRRMYKLDHVYGLLLTFALAMIIQGVVRLVFNNAGLPYRIPEELQGAMNLGFMFMPYYRAWVVVAALSVCLVTWFLIERTSLGAKLRAATENAPLVQSFGVNVPRMVLLTYAGGAGLAAFAGVLAAPVYSVNVNMGEHFMITVFAIVVIGGMGSIMGSVVASLILGMIEGLTKLFYPEASALVIFIVMIFVLLTKPAGLFGRGN
ncbi:branched-chain amino acid ABC transporter permease [Comamonadaceae bacterium G21597-S1]|nr:branched-chain amino acid ABC transporter permease [Comamonadaceae bacterium G21597-S1]